MDEEAENKAAREAREDGDSVSPPPIRKEDLSEDEVLEMGAEHADDIDDEDLEEEGF